MIELKKLLIEGRYDKITTDISRNIVNSLKKKKKKDIILFEIPSFNDGYEMNEIELVYHIKYKSNLAYPFDIYAESDDSTIEIWIDLNPTKLPELLSELIPQLKETIIHEFEHVSQQLGIRPVKSKTRSNKNTLTDYFLLPQEIPAFSKGLYKIAKIKKLPIDVVLDDFFEDYKDRISSESILKIKTIWLKYIKNNFPNAKFKTSP